MFAFRALVAIRSCQGFFYVMFQTYCNDKLGVHKITLETVVYVEKKKCLFDFQNSIFYGETFFLLS